VSPEAKLAPLQPFQDIPEAVVAGVCVLASDIDDTITAEGRLDGRILDLLSELGRAGLLVALVTGRSAGWAQALAGYLPGVCVAVGENGLVSFDRQGGRRDLGPPRGVDFQQALVAQAERVKRAFSLVRTDDDDFRLFERTFERPASFAAASLRRCQETVAPGFEVIASSIHIHVRPSGWDKADGLLAAVAPLLPGLTAGDPRILFVGDSSNDRPLFARFPRSSVGVRNVERFLDELGPDRPTFITRAAAAAGFAEVAERLLAARRATPSVG
jgi:HAD superfamily hydrolase (TIGR01484 family)